MAEPGILRGPGIDDVVFVPERGCVDLERQVWERLSQSGDFWRAVDKGYLGIERRSESTVRLCGNCFVGRFVCGDVAVEVHEKVPHALANLLGFAGEEAFRIARLTSSASTLGELTHLIVKSLLVEVHSYVTAGRESRYTYLPESGPLVAGRLNITKSVKLRARGLRHILAFERPYLSFATEVNVVVGAALSEAIWLARAADLEQGLIATARGLSMLFEDCRTEVRSFLGRDRLAATADELANRPEHLQRRHLLALSALVLSHETFGEADIRLRQTSRTWFINLENLFESAIRKVMGEHLRGQFEVSRASSPVPVFAEHVGEYRANPDILVTRQAAPAAAGDVKYKHFSGSASASDIYQILVHAATYKSDRCFLVHPGDAFKVHRLGKSATGCETWLFQVDLGNLRGSVGEMCELMFGKKRNS